ncbi:MAG: Cytochrome C biogenesis protein transmembrane region [Deltaproteobacteria bacterium ADurb.Bin510]|nr:MAG: Cytochrome C biogenesis protein transmembrane region [Deltaproteobacteria bacterium ADurb.Bin510]
MSWLAVWAALGLGLMTAISPCPLATNVAAMAYIGRNISSRRRVLLAGLAYTAGRMLVYAGLAAMLVASLAAIPAVANYLQLYFNRLLGPVLLLVGLILLELVSFKWPGLDGQRLNFLAARGDLLGAGLLGALFALAFCPVSAAFFFGSLIPLAVRHESVVLLPGLFGLGTGLPVAGFAVLIAFGLNSLGTVFKRVERIEFWLRRATAVIFLGVGAYFSLVHLAGLRLG